MSRRGASLVGGGILLLLVILLARDLPAQRTPPLRVREADGSPNVIPVYDITVSNGDLTRDSAGKVTIDTSGGGGGGDNVTVNSTAVDTTADFADTIYEEWSVVDGGAGGPDTVNVKPDFDQTLAGNPALEVDEWIPFKDTSGGGILAEGSTANTNEQLYRLPDVDGADTTGHFVISSSALSSTQISSFSGSDSALVTGTAGSDTHCAQWNADGDLVTSGAVCATDTDTNSVKEYVWPASALLPLQDADAIPPISKDAGTNLDGLVRLFDSASEECGTASFKVPSDVDTGGTVTLRYIWYADTTSGNVVWQFDHTSGDTEAESWDSALTSVSAAADAVQGTLDLITVTTDTETITNLGWAANDIVGAQVCRDGTDVNDTMNANDASLISFSVEIPRA